MSHKAEHIAGKKALLDDGTRANIDHWVAKFPPEHKRSALIQALSTTSGPICSALGFEEVCTQELYVWSPEGEG